MATKTSVRKKSTKQGKKPKPKNGGFKPKTPNPNRCVAKPDLRGGASHMVRQSIDTHLSAAPGANMRDIIVAAEKEWGAPISQGFAMLAFSLTPVGNESTEDVMILRGYNQTEVYRRSIAHVAAAEEVLAADLSSEEISQVKALIKSFSVKQASRPKLTLVRKAS